MTCAFKFNPKTAVFFGIILVCKALKSSCPFKVGISGYGNLRTMSMDKWATSKSTQLQQKFGSNCSLCDFNAVFPTLTKQTISAIIQKVMPIILTLFSTKMWFLLFLHYCGNNLPRPIHHAVSTYSSYLHTVVSRVNTNELNVQTVYHLDGNNNYHLRGDIAVGAFYLCGCCDTNTSNK